jgi:glycine/D-amino acid oxidase-like deaminating enzyme
VSPGCHDVEVRVVIVGAGPQGLAAALHLAEADPRLREDLVVIDAAGGWLRSWDRQFARLQIDHLRSPGVHHPGCDPHELTTWARDRGLGSTLRTQYSLPDTSTFRSFCDHLVTRAELVEHVVPTKVRAIEPGAEATRVVLGDGCRITARHVVLAGDPARRRIPTWIADLLPVPPECLAHAADVDLRDLDLQGQHVAVVGGGLTAGHLAVGAVERGATVTLLSRRPLRERMFDTDPGWLGPKHLRGFRATSDPAERLRLALEARDGGSLPPWMLHRLEAAGDDGSLTCGAPLRVCGAQRSGSRIELVLGDESRVHVDRVWLATGTRPDVDACHLTATLAQQADDVRIVDGWPVLDQDLCWPGTNVHVLGRLAMLSLGPAAGNLWGARMGAAKVAAHICPPRSVAARRAPTPARARDTEVAGHAQ